MHRFYMVQSFTRFHRNVCIVCPLHLKYHSGTLSQLLICSWCISIRLLLLLLSSSLQKWKNSHESWSMSLRWPTHASTLRSLLQTSAVMWVFLPPCAQQHNCQTFSLFGGQHTYKCSCVCISSWTLEFIFSLDGCFFCWKWCLYMYVGECFVSKLLLALDERFPVFSRDV